jgi:hypothetical protein
MPGYVHEMSSEMSKAYFLAALETGDPIYVDGTGTNVKKVIDQVALAKKAGYKVSLVFVTTPLVVAEIRNATRERKVNPVEIVRQWHLVQNSFVHLRPLVDKSQVIINRNDSFDIQTYKRNKDTVESFIIKDSTYQSLYDLIQNEAPQEISEWGRLLTSKEG